MLGTLLAPRHPALRKSLNDSANLFLAPHPAIFDRVSSPNKMGSSNAYTSPSAPEGAVRQVTVNA
jgi:hypothetical protein